jgi:hypothetical protein
MLKKKRDCSKLKRWLEKLRIIRLIREIKERLKDLILPEDRSLSAFLLTRQYENQQLCIPARSRSERPGVSSVSNLEEWISFFHQTRRSP